jgi:subtilase family protein
MNTEEKLLIRLVTLTFDPLEKLDIHTELRIDEASTKPEHYIVQFHKPLTRKEQTHIQDTYNLKLTEYIPDFAYLEMVDPEVLVKLSSEPLFRATVPYHPAFKISPFIGERRFRTPERQKMEGLWLSAILFDDSPKDKVVEILRNLNVEKITVIDDRKIGGKLQIRFIIPSKKELENIARIPEVRWIEEIAEINMDNGTTAGTIQSGTTGTTPIWKAGLHGENQIIGVLDSVVDIAHCFFRDNANNTPGPAHRKVVAPLRNLSAEGVGEHGTFVAGIAVGDDFNNPGTHANRGMAWAARITFGNNDDVRNGLTSMLTYLTQAFNDGARVHTNSWHQEPVPQYNQTAADVDSFVWNNEDNLVLGSSGNANQTPPETIGPPGTAKNAMCVSASQRDPNEMNFGDGCDGPTPDGRRKPEIVSPGCNINSSQVSTPCGIATGGCATSWATPATAGASALARQYYIEGFYPTGTRLSLHSFIPSGALLKATLLNGTIDMTGIADYPNNREGWGLIRLNNVLSFPGSTRSLRIWDTRNLTGITTGDIRIHHVNVVNNMQPLKLTLVWSEPPGAVSSANPVVNNLDLEVVSPDGTQTFRGNVFAGGISVTGGTADANNNVEMVLINNPVQGDWTIRVIGTAVNIGNPGQGYALVVTGEIGNIITKIEIDVETGAIERAGTNGRVYLGICGREFRLDKLGDQFRVGIIDNFIIGTGSNIKNPNGINDIINSSNSYEIDTHVLNIFPKYIRFEPQDNDDNWNVSRVELRVTDDTNIVHKFNALDGNGSIWLGENSGLFLGLK